MVVVGIIAVLIAMLMPALSKVRKHALELKCAANLHSIGQALMMYTQTYGYYPGCSTYELAVWPPRVRRCMSGGSATFLCPAQDERCEWSMGAPAPAGRAGKEASCWGYEEGEPLLHGRMSFFSYGYNMWGTNGPGGWVNQLNGFNGPMHVGLGEHVDHDPLLAPAGVRWELPANRVKVPSEMIAVSDSTVDGQWDFRIVPPRASEATGWLSPLPPWPGTIHRGGANVLFCDGHVQWYLQRDLMVAEQYDESKAGVRMMWNNDHDPHWSGR